MRIIQYLNKLKTFRRASFRQRTTAGLVFAGVVVLFILLALAAHYEVTLWSYPCGFRQKYNLPCPTCGITTSTLAFAQGKILESFYIQPAAAILCSALVITAFLAFLTAAFGVYFDFLKFFTKAKVKYIILVIVVVLALGWIVTLVRMMAANN